MVENGEGAFFDTITELIDATKIVIRPESLLLESVAEDKPLSLNQNHPKLMTKEPINIP